jgi:hypothetical protein
MSKSFILSAISTGLFAVFLVNTSAFSFCLRDNLPTTYPSHSCTKPDLPPCIYSKNCSEDEISITKIKVENYRMCVSRYLEDVKNHIECAQERASEARHEYNDFINSLK